MANQSDEIRDLLALVLKNKLDLSKVDIEEIDPRVLAVARAFIKDNPPEDVPTTDSDTGLLEEHLNELNEQLPFAGDGGSQGPAQS